MIFADINTWADFEGALEPLGQKAKGDAFEELTYWFFRLNEVHASQYDEVWRWSDVPERVKEALNLPDQDLGIDLLLQKGSEYHAVQCKYHTNRHANVTFREVATFLSVLESNDLISLGYICSSANGLSANFQKVSQNTKQVQRVLSDTWSTLGEEFYGRIRASLKGEATTIKPYEPRAHQRDAIDKAVKHFVVDGNRRGKLIFPCGAGKSLTGYWITQALKSKKTLVAVPSLSLVKQTIEVYLRECAAIDRRVKWICICSDDGIGRGDDVVMYHNDLGVPCETDVDVISSWLKANANEDVVVFTTYQSGRVIAEAARSMGLEFDLGIFDEAHKTVGSKDKLFSHLLFEDNIAIGRRIFMTATERFYAGSKDDIISMGDDEVYGETFVQMTFKEAIEQELLTDYKVITIEVQETEVADFIRQNNLIELNAKWGKEAEARSLASMLALRKAMKRFPIRNAVSFHSSIDKAKRSKELQSYITDSYGYSEIDTYTVSGKIPTTKRNDIVQEFARSESALITNARCLTEGVDVPNIDCIVFADPRRSKVDIVQALGRALRKKDGKDWGYVVLPVIYDEETGEIDNDNFAEILAVVRGLASNDERIIDYFKSNALDVNRKRRPEAGQFEMQIVSDGVAESQLHAALNVRLWEKLIRYDWMSFEDARRFVHGLGLNSLTDWTEFCRSGKRPSNVPAAPNIVYKDDGWQSWGDWFGTGYVAAQLREYRPFEEAREFVRQLGLKNFDEWRIWAASEDRPHHIHSNPRSFYADSGWVSLGDWLGTGNVAPKELYDYLSFAEAKSFVHSLRLRNQKEWADFVKSGEKPDFIPGHPERIYKREWTNLGEWLGNGSIATRDKVYRDFDDARKFARGLGLSRSNEWFDYCKSGEKPEDIPTSPRSTYKDKGWVNMGDWLGTNRVANHKRKYLGFDEARTFARGLGLSGKTAWEKWSAEGRRPNNIPGNPRKVYKETGWNGWADWLGTGNLHPAQKKALYCDFEEARKFVRGKNFVSSTQYEEFCRSEKKPVFLAPWPAQTYKDKWQGWPHFLGLED